MSERPSIAVVGGGFGGVGAAVMLSREGYHDVTVFEKSDRIGGLLRYGRFAPTSRASPVTLGCSIGSAPAPR